MPNIPDSPPPSGAQVPDKTGDALKAQRFEMLEDIAKELGGEVIFPTCFDVIMRLRKLLDDPNQSMADVAAGVSVEPLISAKLLQLANSVAFNPEGSKILDLKSAITRLGLNAVRTAAMTIVMTQMLRAKGMSHFTELTHALWEHTIRTAAAARIIAATVPRLNRDEAMLAGLIHDLGAFYMLYRATQYDELLNRPDTIKYLMIQWHESIGVSLLNALGLPEEIVEATIDHDHLRPLPQPLRNLADVLYIANMLCGGHFEWLLQDKSDDQDYLAALEQKYGHLLPEIEALATEMRGSFA